MRSLIKSFVVFLLTAEAKALLGRSEPTIVAVTGSIGKTSAKDAIYAVLSTRLHVRKSAKSMNSDFGVPLAILGLDGGWSSPIRWLVTIVQGLLAVFSREPYPRWLVLEVGADRPGDIERIASWLKPHIVVLTGIPDVPPHVEFFSSPEELAKEKAQLVAHMRAGGTLIANGENERSAAIARSFGATAITYGFGGENTLSASRDAIFYGGGMPLGVRAQVKDASGTYRISIGGALGRPRVYAGLAALAVAEKAGIDRETALGALERWNPPPGRMRVLPGIKGSVIIDDTYNSSPAAAKSALDALKKVKARRRIAVLGDMLEIGKFSAEEHRKLGEIAAHSADLVWTVGFRARAAAEAVRDAGLPETSVRSYEQGEAARAGKELEAVLEEGDVVLVKGSQGMRMEKTVLEIMAEPALAGELLCRQEPDWLRR